MMELWPFTNFHDLNLDWIIKTLKEWVSKMTDVLNDWHTMEDDWQEFIDSTYKEQITEILAEHPEWVTTVMDGAITEPKINADFLKEIKNVFVTPEQFGAVGDGVADDTPAWQDAVDAGLPVIALSEKYKCGQITVTKNIDIDLNNAEFYCTDLELFHCEGELVTSFANAGNYNAYDADYTISNSAYSDYTGFAFMKGDNNFEKARTYYKGGFTCLFNNGKIGSSYPIPVTNVYIDIINPVTVNFRNVGKIMHADETLDNISIHILYGYGCKIDQTNLKDSNGYYIIMLEKSESCILEGVRGNRDLNHPNLQNYPIGMIDTSNTDIRDVDYYNEYWHVATTGGEYLCYNNKISNAVMLSGNQYGYLDHENAVGTIIDNVTSSGIALAASGKAKNIDIVPMKNNTYKRCDIKIIPSSNENLAYYDVENINIMADSDGSAGYAGVDISVTPLTTGYTYYVKQLRCKNIFRYGINSTSGGFTQSVGQVDVVLETVIIDNSNMPVFMGKTTTTPNLDISNYKLFYKNITEKLLPTAYPTLGYAGYTFNDVIIENAYLKDLIGTYNSVIMDDVTFTETVNNQTISKLEGSKIHSRLHLAMLTAIPVVRISDMAFNPGVYYYDIQKQSNNTLFCWRWVNGVIQALDLTTP